jgi:hypothetical protein
VSNDVLALPPTFGIEDLHVRAFCEALAQAWAVRNDGAGKDGDRFVRKDEVASMASDAVVNILSGAAAAATGGSVPTPLAAYTSVVRSVTDLVLNSKAYEWLREGAKPINAPNGNQGPNILAEQQLRSDKDNALAQAINTIWSQIGGSSALIQDGALAEVSPAAVEATKWDEVVAAVTDPNTGQISTTSIREELDAYESKVDGTMNTTWGVRSNVNGVVTGVVLMTSAGAGSPPGTATSDFMVMADRFSLVNPDNTSQTPVPFTVDSGGNAVFTGTVYAADGVFGGDLQAARISVGTSASATMFYDPSNVGVSLYSSATGLLTLDAYIGAAVSTSDELLFKNGDNTWPIERRIKTGQVFFSLNASAVVDDMFSIWYRVNGGAWVFLVNVHEPQAGDGPVALAAGHTFTVNTGDTVQFGVSPTDQNFNSNDMSKLYIHLCSVVAQGRNF